MGGGVSWHYARAHPERVTALGLIDAAGAPRWEAKTVPIGFRLARMPIARDLMAKVTPRSMVETSLRQSVSVQSIVTDAMVDRYWELLLYPGNRQATLDRFALVHNVEPASKEALARITAPTLIMWGEEDGLIPVSSAKWFAGALPKAETVIYPGIGHVPMEELPDRSAADFDAFLQRALTTKPALTAKN
jgi:pimeloyl-ACP methyl ester carboxylesterase